MAAAHSFPPPPVDGAVAVISLAPERPRPAPAVELQAVTKRYGKADRPALNDVSLTFPRGSFTAVMGLSGSGKSTLLHCAAGLDRPSSGSVRLGGVEISSMGRKSLAVLRRRQVGFVFQQLNLVPTLTVGENIALPLRLDRQRVDRDAVTEVARRVGVEALLRRMPGTLSGGQQQRVAIARALITEPEVVFADEPSAALDPYTSRAMRSLLRWAADELGQTVVLVTHEPSMAEAADRAVVLHHGEIHCELAAAGAKDLGELLLGLGGR